MFDIERLGSENFKVLSDRLGYELINTVKVNDSVIIHELKRSEAYDAFHLSYPKRLSCVVTNPNDGVNTIIFDWAGYNDDGEFQVHMFTKYNPYKPKLWVKPYVILSTLAVTRFRNALQHAMTEFCEYEYNKHKEEKENAKV